MRFGLVLSSAVCSVLSFRHARSHRGGDLIRLGHDSLGIGNPFMSNDPKPIPNRVQSLHQYTSFGLTFTQLEHQVYTTSVIGQA